MSLVKRIRPKGTRQVGLVLAGLLVAVLAAASGTALASSGSSSSAASMTGMAQSMSASWQYLQRHDPSEVTGNITTSLFLFFSVLH